jgi:hypothetical protein
LRRLISFLLALALLVTPFCLAEGDPNIDGSGGGTGSGSGSNAWNGGDDGVRVTVLKDAAPVAILDYSNVQRSRTQWSFKQQCKLYYKNGGQLVPNVSQYTNFVPAVTLPRIISTTGGSNIDAVRSYFTDRVVLTNLANDSGIAYDDLVSGDYELMLEPISYFKYDGVQYAMTATEAALFDVKVNGDLRYWMGTLTHQNQPLSMYLDHADLNLGIQAWQGPFSGKQADIDILNCLGVGIVSFKPQEKVDPPVGLGDYTYHTDTDVITAAFVHNNSNHAVTPDDNNYVKFHILGRSYRVQYVCPALSGQLVWVKWHTPKTPQDIEIDVSDGTVITASIRNMPDVEPPDPDFYDTNTGLTDKTAPDWGSQKSVSWSEWVPVWHVPVPTLLGVTPGYWTFRKADYHSGLSVNYKLTPDAKVPTATTAAGEPEIKSAYGVDAACKVRVSSSSGVADADVTPVQNMMAVFQDFGYATYDRLLTPEKEGFYKTTWHFKPNKYSYYGRPVHFTPLWWPDGKDYTVPLLVLDSWTPGGQLYATVKDSVRVDSGSVYTDWYAHVTQPR